MLGNPKLQAIQKQVYETGFEIMVPWNLSFKAKLQKYVFF